MSSNARRNIGIVLIVDDVPGNLAVLHDALDRHGFEVRVATSGHHALESARLAPPDLILLDAAMPGLNGFETCRRLKATLETRHIPVIFMTGLTESEDVVRGFQAGGIDYVTKPVRPTELLARIASHLRNSRLVADTLGAADAAGDAIVSLEADGRVQWATPLASAWIGPLLDAESRAPAALRSWMKSPGGDAEASFVLSTQGERLVFTRIAGGNTLLVQRHASIPPQLRAVETPAVLART